MCAQLPWTMPSPGSAEVRHGFAQELGLRHEVGVEDGDQLAPGALEAGCQRSGLEAAAVGPVEVVDVDPETALLFHHLGDDAGGLVGRVVEDLDLQRSRG